MVPLGAIGDIQVRHLLGDDDLVGTAVNNYQANKAMTYPTLKFFNISRFKNERTEVSTPKISLSVAIVNGDFLTDLQLRCL